MFFTESLVGGYKNPLGIEIGLKKKIRRPSPLHILLSSPLLLPILPRNSYFVEGPLDLCLGSFLHLSPSCQVHA